MIHGTVSSCCISAQAYSLKINYTDLLYACRMYRRSDEAIVFPSFKPLHKIYSFLLLLISPGFLI